MKPVRGQIIHCKNQAHITEAVTIGAGDEGAYMIPRGDVIVYGGTSDENDPTKDHAAFRRGRMAINTSSAMARRPVPAARCTKTASPQKAG